MSHKIFVVTGANQGIGYGIVEALAKTLNSAIIYLTGELLYYFYMWKLYFLYGNNFEFQLEMLREARLQFQSWSNR